MRKKFNLKNMQKEVEKEFPGDYALQQIHLARKILSKEAEEKGISFIQHIKEETKQLTSAGKTL